MTQLLTVLRAIHAGAKASDHGVGYSQLAEATGISQRLLLRKAWHLKAQGLIERANPDARQCDHAFFRVTAAGAALVRCEAEEQAPAETTVQRAIRGRHPLATVWSVA